jgi:hypothetical protein
MLMTDRSAGGVVMSVTSGRPVVMSEVLFVTTGSGGRTGHTSVIFIAGRGSAACAGLFEPDNESEHKQTR